MQISAVTPVQTPATAERNATAAAAANAQKEAQAEEAAKKVFTPAPPLRPNVQDYVDINRTLLALRKL